MEIGEEPSPLSVSPTVAQIKHHVKKTAKKFKTLSFISPTMFKSIYADYVLLN